MPLAKTIWRQGMVWLGAAFLLALSIFCLYQLYRAYAHGTVEVFSRSGGLVSFGAHPIWFVWSITWYAVFVVVSAGLAILIWLGDRRQRRNIERLVTRPPFDDARRESIDRR